MTKELTIETLPVEIKVIRVGGHKMTKAVWNQIQCQKYQVYDKALGYIIDEGDRWLLFICKATQELRKGWICRYAVRDNEEDEFCCKFEMLLATSRTHHCGIAKNEYLPFCECVAVDLISDCHIPQLFIAT